MPSIIIKNQIVLFDEQDLPLVESYKWYITNYGYAATVTYPTVGMYIPRGSTIEDFKRTICMHSLIMCNKESGLEIDHINWNKLDNRRCNLRAVSHSENMKNKPLPLYSGNNKTSLYKGVSRRGDKWQVVMRIDGKLKFLGTFKNQHEAGMFANDQFEKINLQKEIERNRLMEQAYNSCYA